MTHKILIKRISDFCNKLEEGSEERLQYLFFIASIAEDDSHDLQEQLLGVDEVLHEPLSVCDDVVSDPSLADTAL